MNSNSASSTSKSCRLSRAGLSGNLELILFRALDLLCLISNIDKRNKTFDLCICCLVSTIHSQSVDYSTDADYSTDEERDKREIAMEFCPTCGNLLQIEHPYMSQSLRFFCPTCPYIFPIERKISKKLQLKQKEVDDVFGGEEAWKNVDRTEATCPKCSFGKAFFMQIQIRSADEPMSTFYKCCNNQCQFRWRQD